MTPAWTTESPWLKERTAYWNLTSDCFMCAVAAHPHSYTLIKEHSFRKLFRGLHIYCLYMERELVSARELASAPMVGCWPYCPYCSCMPHVPDHGTQQGHSWLSDFGFPSLFSLDEMVAKGKADTVNFCHPQNWDHVTWINDMLSHAWPLYFLLRAVTNHRLQTAIVGKNEILRRDLCLSPLSSHGEEQISSKEDWSPTDILTMPSCFHYTL